MSTNFLPDDFPSQILTLEQPQGWLIQQGHSTDVIAREATCYRGPVLLHVGMEIDEARMSASKMEESIPTPRRSDCFTFAVFGLAKVVDCLPWTENSFRLVLADVVPCSPAKWNKERPGLSVLTPGQRSTLFQLFAHRREHFQRTQRIRERLKALDLPYKKFCNIADLPPRVITDAIRDDSGTEGEEALEQIAFALAVSPEWILTGEGDISPVDTHNSKQIAWQVNRCLKRISRSNVEIAGELGVSVATLKRLRVRVVESDGKHLDKLAEIIGTTTEWLKTGIDPATGVSVGIKSVISKSKSAKKQATKLTWWDRAMAQPQSKSQNVVWIAPPEKDAEPLESTAEGDENAFKAARVTMDLKLSEVASHLGVSALTLLELEDKPSRAPAELKVRWQAFLDKASLKRNNSLF